MAGDTTISMLYFTLDIRLQLKPSSLGKFFLTFINPEVVHGF